MISQQKFNELVESTTTYIQNLMNRVKVLEDKVAKLEKPATKTTTTKAEA